MEKFEITGGRTLNGSIAITKSKNAILPIIAAAVLTEGVNKIFDVPDLVDIDKMLHIYSSLGGKVKKESRTVSLDGADIKDFTIPNELTKDIRASIFMLGPLLSKFRHAVVAYPGGCNIGARPIDIHLNGLQALGVKITEAEGLIICDGTEMKSGSCRFSFPSVGATENLMMSAVLLPGVTILENAAKEPEITDLSDFINAMGGKISGAGTDTITIEGVTKLHGVEYTPIGDRIIAGTYLLATLIAGGDVELYYDTPKHIQSLLTKLRNCACKISIFNDRMRVTSSGRLKSIKNIVTKPYPDYPTDLQAPMMALQCVSRGKSVISETIFENRFRQVQELIKMGADIKVVGNIATITGVKKLHGTKVNVTDLRAGASLVLAGLGAEGVTEVLDIAQIDRGYEKMEENLKQLNAEIKRIREG